MCVLLFYVNSPIVLTVNLHIRRSLDHTMTKELAGVSSGMTEIAGRVS